MKKILAFFCAAATIAAAASCTQNGIDVLPDNNEGVTFTANACDITKISIDDEFHAYWNTKDWISLMDSNGEYEEVLVDAAYDGMATAVFNTTHLSPTADRYFAMACDYNTTALSKEDNSFRVERDNIFRGTIGEAYVGYAGSDSKTLTFDCLTSIIRFTTTESHESITLFCGDNEKFYTSAVVTPSTDPVSAASVYELELLPTVANSMRVKPDNAAPGTYYIGIFPGTYNCLDFAVTGNAHATIYGEVTLEAGKIYDFGDIDSRLGYKYYTVTTPVFTADEAEAYNNYLYGNIGNSSIYYSTEKGGAATAPAYNANSSEVRLYQAGTGQATGGVLTIESTTGDQIKGVQLMIGSTDATFAYTIGTNTELSANIDVPRGTNYTLNGINSSKVTFYCTGTDKNHRLVFQGIRVTYVEDGRTAQQLSFPIPTYDLTATIGETFDAPTVEGAMTPVTYTSSNPEVATVDATTGAVTLVEPGTTVITATAEESDVYKAASVSYNLTVVEAGITSLKALKEKLLTYTTATDFTAEVTNAIVTSISENGLHFYLEDAEAGVYCYNISENGLSVGDCLTGTITGRGYNYNGIPEVTKFEFSGSKSTATLPEQSVSLADFAGDGFQTYLCRRVKLSDVTIGDGFGGTDREGTLVEGQYTVGVRTASAASVTTSYIQGSVIDLICIPSYYKPSEGEVEGRLMIGWDADITVKSTPTPTDLGLATLKTKLLASTSAAPYSGSVILEDAVITGVFQDKGKNNFYLEDADAAVYFYGISSADFDLVAGTVLNGTLTASGYNYNNGIPEVTSFSFDGQTSVSSDIPVTEVTTASLEENYDDLACRRISIKNVTVTDGFGGSDLDGSIMQDNTAATIRTASSAVVTQSYSSGSKISLYGFPSYYKGNHQISIISDNDITVSGKMAGEITALTSKQMYVGDHWEVGATANSGATVSYSIDNSNVAFLSPVAVGYVEAKSAGTCTLTMTAPETDQYTAASLTCTITVSEIPSGTLYFEKVTAAPNSWEGTYLIVYTDGNLAFNGSLDELDVSGNSVEVSINSGKIEATEAMRACAFTIGTDTSIDGYYIKSASGYYIGETTEENKIKTSKTTMYSNTISFISEDDIDITSGGPHLRYNSTSGSGNLRFRYYKTASYKNQKAIQLYRLSE